MKLLTDITFHTRTNNYYAPLANFWESHKSVCVAEYMDKTSLTGDWSGYIIQRIGKNVYAIGFSQESSHPGRITLRTCEHPFYQGRIDENRLVSNVRLCWEQFTDIKEKNIWYSTLHPDAATSSMQ